MNTTATTALVPRHDCSLAEMEGYGKHFAASLFFKDVRSVSQAIVKMLAGRELGFGFFAAQQAFYIIEGKAVMSADGMSGLILREGSRYDYEIKKSDVTSCILVFKRRDDKGEWQVRGEVSYTMAEAKTAGLDKKKNWLQNPSDMLFARALSRGYRRFCRDLGMGVYTYDEMGIDVDAEGNPLNLPASPEPLIVEVSEASTWRPQLEKFLDSQKLTIQWVADTLGYEVKSLDDLSEREGTQLLKLAEHRPT